MSLGLYSGSPGLSVGIGLYQGSLGLFSGSPGLISGNAPSLYLLFTQTETLDPRITFTRASSATRVNSSGLIETVSSDVARFDYNPVTLAAKGLLIEEQRTNLALQSAAPNGGVNWFATAGSIGASVTTDLFGTTTAALITADGAVAAHHVFNGNITNVSYVSGTTYALSYWVKAGTQSLVQLTAPTAAFGAAQYANFNLATGAVTASTGCTASIVPAPNGFYRITIVLAATATIAATTGSVIFISAASDTRLPANTLTTNFHVAAVQTEAGPFATSYIPTTSATVPREADVASMTGTNFSDWFNQSQGTIVFVGDTPASGTRVIWQADDGAANNRYTLYTTGTSLKFDVVTGGVTQASLTLGTIVANTQFKAAVAFAANDIAGVLNGGTVQTDVSATLPVVDRFRLGCGTSSNYQCGHHARDVAYPARLGNALLQTLSM